MSAIQIDDKSHSRMLALLRQDKILVFILLVITALVYLPMFTNSLTNWDEIYILHNPYLRSLSFNSLKNVFISFYSGNYHPLTLLSLAINYKIGGMHPWIYQLTNLILHLGNTWLVYVFVKSLLSKISLSLNSSAIASTTALLFGVHTLQVESVAWMSERKNVLYTFFFLLSLLTYLKYLDKKALKFYMLSLVFFILSLLSKGMAVPLAMCIILIDYVTGRNILLQKVILEKIPFFLLALLFGYIAIRAQHTVDAIREDSNFMLLDRIAVASYGFIEYLIKLCFPRHLSAFYPYPSKTGAFLPVKFYMYIVLILSLFIILWKYSRQHKVIIFGSLFFIVNISIVIQLLPVGDAIMSDRYVYIASIGFFLILGYLVSILWQRNRLYRTITLFVITGYAVLLSLKTYHRVSVWKDSKTLWSDALTNCPENNDRALQNLGNISYETGDYTKALQYYERILKMHLQNKSAYSKAYVGSGQVKQALNDLQGAMSDYNASVACYPSFEGFYNRAVLKISAGTLTDAMVDLDKAIEIDPIRIEAYNNRGAVYSQLGNFTEAMQNYNQALQLDPQNHRSILGKGLLKQAMNDMSGAMSDFNAALSIEQSYDGYLDRAVLKMALKDFDGARIDLSLASQMDPLKPEAYINSGVIEMNTGNALRAVKEFNKAIDVKGDDFRGYLCRGFAKINLSAYKEAIADLDKSIQLHSNAEAFYYRGLAKKQLGYTAAACEDFHQSEIMGFAIAHTEILKNCK